MIAIEVSVNGQRLCLAGVGDTGVLSAIVNWVGKPSQADIFMSVGGLNSSTDEYLRWAVPTIGVGTEVTIRVVEADGVDPPRRYPGDWDGYTDDQVEQPEPSETTEDVG